MISIPSLIQVLDEKTVFSVADDIGFMDYFREYPTMKPGDRMLVLAMHTRRVFPESALMGHRLVLIGITSRGLGAIEGPLSTYSYSPWFKRVDQ